MVEDIRQGDIPGVQLRQRQSLPASTSVVWRWLTETEYLERWLCQHATATTGDSDGLLLETTTQDGLTLRESLLRRRSRPSHYLAVDLQRLDADWPTSTRLVFELTETIAGTELSVLQKGFAHLPLSDCLTIWESYRNRWRDALARLADQLATHPDS